MVEGPAAARPDWVPDSDRIAESNVGDLMRRVGTSGFDDLHRWSVANPGGFWSIVVEDLDIAFTVEPVAVLGSSNPEAPMWLDGARMNIAASCLDGDPERTAIVHGTAGDVSTVTVGELRNLVARFASGFRNAGFSPRDRIAIAMPMTLEAVMLHSLDDMDAQIHSFDGLMRADSNADSHWTQYHHNLGRKLFKGTPAG